MAKKIEAKLILGELHLFNETEIQTPSFQEYAENWMTFTIPATCKSSTEKDYQNILDNHVLPAFGNKPVMEIKRLMIKNFLMRKIKSGFAPSKVSHMKCSIGGTLDVAVDDGILTANPAHRLGKIFKKKNGQNDIRPYSRDDLSSLLESFLNHFPDHYPQVCWHGKVCDWANHWRFNGMTSILKEDSFPFRGLSQGGKSGCRKMENAGVLTCQSN